MCGVGDICVANNLVGALNNCLEKLFGYEGEVLCEVLLSNSLSLGYVVVMWLCMDVIEGAFDAYLVSICDR